MGWILGKRKWVPWIIYSTTFSGVCTVLLFLATSEEWAGPWTNVLTILCWGAQSYAWLASVLLAGFLTAISAGISGGVIQGLFAAILVFFAIGSLQYLVVAGFFRFLRAVRRGHRAGE